MSRVHDNIHDYHCLIFVVQNILVKCQTNGVDVCDIYELTYLIYLTYMDTLSKIYTNTFITVHLHKLGILP